jgi:YfiH family protein
VGDDPVRVQAHRAQLAREIDAVPVFLSQVHGTQVVRITADDARREQPLQADAALTTQPGVACVVMVADCLPVLFCAPPGRGVAAAHAGWRGLCAGVLEHTVAALCEAAECAASDLQAWLGPCIGPREFEVGDEVRQAFIAGSPAAAVHFRPAAASSTAAVKWLADLQGLARQRLLAVGVHAVSGEAVCTVEDRSRFYSFRRDGTTGRMAAAIWLRRVGGGGGEAEPDGTGDVGRSGAAID